MNNPRSQLSDDIRSFVLFCKSYRNDVLRAKRLLMSINQFNIEKIPFYLSTPLADRQLFIDTLGTEGYTWVSDEEIAAANTRSGTAWLATTHGYVAQQVIKSEFWRLGLCDSYLCLDSDALFIRPFGIKEFVHPSGVPYTVMHDCLELLVEADKRRLFKIRKNFMADSDMLKFEFGRIGNDYDFGPAPLLWSSKVWRWLDESYLCPKGETLLQAITRKPSEIRWYGEALLASKVLPIYKKNPLFRVYHYDWLYEMDLANSVSVADLQSDYLGVIYQSNWEFVLDPPFAKKRFLSIMVRKIKKFISQKIKFMLCM